MGKKNRSKKIQDAGKAADFKANPFAALSIPDLPKDAKTAKKQQEKKESPAPANSNLSRADQELLEQFGDDDTRIMHGQAVGRLTMRVQKKGHGGKTWTHIFGLEHLDMAAQMEILKGARKALAVGGSFQDGVLEIQGGQIERAAAYFRKLGYIVAV